MGGKMMLDFPEELLDDFDLELEEEPVIEVHGDDEMEAYHMYGPCKKGKWYRIIEEKGDWIAIRLRGKRVIVPDWVFKYGKN